MRFRTSFFFSLFAVIFLVLPHFAHAAIPFFGPIIPQGAGQAVCPAGWGMFMTVVNNIIQFLLTFAIVFVTPLTLAYAGFILVFNQGNPGKVTEARKVITNTIVGIIIALASWMIIDAIMAVLYNPGAAGGTWSSLIYSSGDYCLPQAGTLPGDAFNPSSFSSGVSVSSGGAGAVNTGSAAQCPNSNPGCSVAALQAAGFTATQANVMSCIAVTESSGNPSLCNGNACGTFQIMLTVNQLVGPACGGTLNCPALCKGSSGAAVTTAACQPCVAAAKNATCNAQAAQYLYSKAGYTPWTTASDNTKSAACIAKYGG